jgi:hypothetical protein
MTENTVLADFISEKSLARQLGQHERTLARWRTERRGPPFILNGRQILYHRDDVGVWLRKGGVANGAPNKRKR